MNKQKIKKAIKMLLEAVGEDAGRKDLVTTPERTADMYEELLSGMKMDPEKELEVFLAENHEEIVLLKDIPLYSICEHHLLPFTGKVHLAYIPKKGRITGLSSLVKVVEILSRRLQVQERLNKQIADILMKKLSPQGVIVVIEAEHLCMSMRGVKKSGVITVTSAVRGVFKDNQKTRAEALELIRKGN